MVLETLNFRTSSGIKNIVGRDLITDKFVAIFELVKNSYDAKAKNVVVSFNNLEYQNKKDLLDDSAEKSLYEISNNEPHLVIRDDGKGMTKNDLINKWLFLAYSEKSNKEGTDNEGRSFVGSKGVGRFSCDTLGERLILKSKVAYEDIEHQLFIDWNQFEKNQEVEFSKVNVEYQSTPVVSDKSYTEIIIRNFRSNSWHLEEEQEKTKKALEKLKNPFIFDDGFNIYVGRDVSQGNLLEINKVDNNIANVIKGYTTTVEVSIGIDDIYFELYDRGEVIFQLNKQNNTILKNTPTTISIHYLNPTAKRFFTRSMGIQPVNYGTIFIYKNGFRVMPYGDENVDLFGLNLRKNQGYSRYVATRELLGYIEINDKNNSFKETSSRNNGFIKNAYFDELENLYLEGIHKILERYIHLIKWGENSETEEAIYFDPQHTELDNFKKYIERKGFSIIYFKDEIEIEIEKNSPEKQLDKLIFDSSDIDVKKTAKKAKQQLHTLKAETQEQSKIIQRKEQQQENLERQVKNLQSKRTDDEFGEQITHHFVGMADKLRTALNRVSPYINRLDSNDRIKALKELDKIRSVQQELSIFKDLLLKTDIDLRTEQRINWYEQARWFVDEKNLLTKRIKITLIDNAERLENWDVTCHVIGLQMMLENFYQNSRDQKATYLNIEFFDEKIVIENNSGPIRSDDKEKILELGYTTKPNGTGIGMYQVNKFLIKYGFSLSIEAKEEIIRFIIAK